MTKRGTVFLLLILFSCLLQPPELVQSKFSRAAVSDQKILVDASDLQAQAELRIAGGKILVDYGAFALWDNPSPALINNLSAASAGQPVQNIPGGNLVDNRILLRGITIQPGESDISQPENLSPSQVERESLWIVQFIGPILPEWLEALQAAGEKLVAYLPNNAYLVWGKQPALDSPFIQWIGPYRSFYRLSPDLRPIVDSLWLADTQLSGKTVKVTIQFYQTGRLAESLNRLQNLAVRVIQPPGALLNMVTTRVEIPVSALAEISSWPDVLNVETFLMPSMLDEKQGQILAGNLTLATGNTVPSRPGYLQWLMSKGFPVQPELYPLVALLDDGVDNGDAARVLHPDFYMLGNKTYPSRVAFMINCSMADSGNSEGGHGNLNAGILGGYNSLSGLPYQDPQGFQLDIGISPYGRFGSTKIFDDYGQYDISRCGDFRSLTNAIYASGARISSNSWGASASGDYDEEAQAFDILTRDASNLPGNQGMLHIFAAGNNRDPQSIGTPGTAKNVLTVGATENVRSDGIFDGCLIASAGNADNVADFSSRGPTRDGRIKPDIMAPGTHVQGPASQDPEYNGTGICGSYANRQSPSRYYPDKQTLYTWSSGTSHATPAIAGVAQLVYYYYQRVLQPGETPSPAMVKALILNTPRYLTGVSANDNLPSPNQGWGDANMSEIFDGTPRLLYDQDNLFNKTGDTFEVSGQVSDSQKPFHVTLVWTDAPGAPYAGNAAVNNLDLEVTIQNQTYRGNVFSGENSIPGGTADSLNNVENVFLPAGAQGAFKVRVVARNLAGDGVPGNRCLTDQDFALVIDNGVNLGIQRTTIKQYWLPLFMHR